MWCRGDYETGCVVQGGLLRLGVWCRCWCWWEGVGGGGGALLATTHIADTYCWQKCCTTLPSAPPLTLCPPHA